MGGRVFNQLIRLAKRNGGAPGIYDLQRGQQMRQGLELGSSTIQRQDKLG